MHRRSILLVDAAINLALGVLLILFPPQVVHLLGVPGADTPFYASILGGVFVGIGIALIVEWRRRPSGLVGLGLGGAIAINLSGALVLAAWLLAGRLALPLRGHLFLGSLRVRNHGSNPRLRPSLGIPFSPTPTASCRPGRALRSSLGGCG